MLFSQCDGLQPCARCRARDMVCVYGKADPDKLALPMTPERGAMLQQQNNRLTRAASRMAARIEVLESSAHGYSGHEKQQDIEMGDASSEVASRAKLVEILDQYAPESADTVELREPYENPRSNGESCNLPAQSKKRRVGNDVGDAAHRERSSFMIMPASQLQAQQVSGFKPSISSMQSGAEHTHIDGPDAAAWPSLDSLDPHLQAYQTLLQTSQAHKSRSTQPENQGGMDVGNLDVADPPEISAAFGSTGQMSSPKAFSSKGFPSSLLDLVDWDASLENCNPISWDWDQNAQ